MIFAMMIAGFSAFDYFTRDTGVEAAVQKEKIPPAVPPREGTAHYPWRVVFYDGNQCCGPRVWIVDEEPQVSGVWVSFRVDGKWKRVRAHVVEQVKPGTKVADGDGRPLPRVLVRDGNKMRLVPRSEAHKYDLPFPDIQPQPKSKPRLVPKK